MNWACEVLDWTESIKGMRSAQLSYCYYLLKILDLFDTVFFVLRKKTQQISFLHVYHHAAVLFGTYIGVQWAPGKVVKILHFYWVFFCHFWISRWTAVVVWRHKLFRTFHHVWLLLWVRIRTRIKDEYIHQEIYNATANCKSFSLLCGFISKIICFYALFLFLSTGSIRCGNHTYESTVIWSRLWLLDQIANFCHFTKLNNADVIFGFLLFGIYKTGKIKSKIKLSSTKPQRSTVDGSKMKNII